MRIIIFTPPNDEKILSGEKTMTARYWRKAPPSLSEVVRAQTGRRKDTTFGYLRIVGTCLWYPFKDTDQDLLNRIGYSKDEIAKKEGYANWDAFFVAYQSLNAHHDADRMRKHYFIEFEVVKV